MDHGQYNSPHIVSIHIVDDESLLNTFYVYRRAMLCEDEDESVRRTTGGIWGREMWWCNDESLLNTFYVYRRAMLCEDEDESVRRTTGGIWGREMWWCKLAHVCQSWRNLILGSASYLGLCLVRTYGTPVADMLKHSPPFPLTIDYSDGEGDIIAENEEGMILALGQRDRAAVRRAHLSMPFPNLQKLLMIIDHG
jgi:hypothetical protein